MNVAQLFILLNEAHMSPEDLATRLGLSGMTLRRWKKAKTNVKLPPLYANAYSNVVYDLILEGKLSCHSKSAKYVFSKDELKPLQVRMSALGVTKDFINGPVDLVSVLGKIGADPKSQKKVEKSLSALAKFKKISQDWNSHLHTLTKIVRSPKLGQFEKLIAYGALFYLITPFDLIPDHIPVFGLMDDFMFLGAAVTYYSKRSVV